MASVQEVLGVLENSGFERLPKPLTIVGTEFDFEAAVRGTETSHDLVVIATDAVAPRRLRRLVAGLARSLDLASSRRPVSLVMLGELAPADRIELERYARVLPISSSKAEIADIKDAVAILLPLDLPNADLVHGSDNEVLAALGPVKSTSDHIALVNAAADGPEAVRETLRRYANEGAGWTDEGTSSDE